ncbi:ras GTPase-activating protein 1 [Onthophagus taurus]|uniref:ras GTPase-activating protein 1 n=1 Tax=Onthophagus taurus TaxID=166361 RepID=UPI000C200BA4|nr:ras GTPase-activating protein 1 [Onthophagus taurus]
MADLIRGSALQGAGIMKDKLGSPSTGSEDGNDQEHPPPPKTEPEDPDLGDSATHAPPETQWYHGRLDRYQAEERLWEENRLGSYLVRESDRKPGSYVLSYLGRTGINHFRITAVCGDFYIGGRQFDSLNDLIGYYTQFSDLLKRERLIHPVAPPEPVNDKKRVVAILPYTKMPDTDELTFKKGDIFFVHNDMGDGWLWVTAHRTGEQGMIFRELVEDLDDSIDPNTVFPWFHPSCTKSEAVDLLVKAGPGSFLVRPSDNSPGDYSLFFHINNQIQRFRIEKRGVRYLMGGRIFECLDAVINRYRKEQIVEGYTLQHPLVVDGSKQLDWVPDGNKMKSEPEKIYATLRECRDQASFKKMKGIKHKGYLHRKPDKVTKKWKLLYFILLVDGTDTLLYIYENPKRTKPKGLIDLSCAYLYQVHDSLWERQYCFQIVEKALPCISTVTHLAAPSLEECQEWINALKPLCVPQMSKATSKVPKLRELRCLTLNILDAHRLPVKFVPQPYITIQLNNQVRIGKTRVKSGSDPIWEEEFVIDDVPCDIVSFTLTVYNKGKRGKDNEVADLHIDLSKLGNGEEHEKWYDLTGVTPIGEWGSLRLRIRYLHDLVMPGEEYSPLQQLLLEPGLTSVKTLAEICHADRQPLAVALLKVFRAEMRETELLRELNNAEIEKETEISTLFRAASLPTTLMDLYMRAECGDFLRAALMDIIQRLLESKQSAELNPNKMDSPDEACSNAEFLLQILDQVTLTIFISLEELPRPVRYICGCLQKAVVAKWPGERFVRTRVVSGFIFLRLLCPALLNPRQFSLVNEQPSQMATRSLVMVAKCLQNLANLVEFGGKEQYMEVVNPFILKNKERMVVFLDQLSAIGDPGELVNINRLDTAKELATLHHICVAHLPELQAISKVNPSLKTLVTVTDMLTKHKQKYLEMIR